MRKSIRVYSWNPNGTNDIEIIANNEVIDSLPEALFGLNTGERDFRVIKPNEAMRYIAVSPMNDGRCVVSMLKKHFG